MFQYMKGLSIYLIHVKHVSTYEKHCICSGELNELKFVLHLIVEAK